MREATKAAIRGESAFRIGGGGRGYRLAIGATGVGIVAACAYESCAHQNKQRVDEIFHKLLLLNALRELAEIAAFLSGEGVIAGDADFVEQAVQLFRVFTVSLHN